MERRQCAGMRAGLLDLYDKIMNQYRTLAEGSLELCLLDTRLGHMATGPDAGVAHMIDPLHGNKCGGLASTCLAPSLARGMCYFQLSSYKATFSACFSSLSFMQCMVYETSCSISVGCSTSSK